MSFDAEQQRNLAERLALYVSQHSHVDLFFADLRQLRLAETVQGIFAAAGWTADLTKAPLPYDEGDYVETTRVTGYNKYLVDSIACELSVCGFSDALSRVKDNPLEPSSPDWLRAQHRVKVIIGPR